MTCFRPCLWLPSPSCVRTQTVDLCPSVDSHLFISRYPSAFKTPQRTLASVVFLLSSDSPFCILSSMFFCFSIFFFLIFKFIFGCAGSLPPHGFFSSRGEWRLLSHCGAHTSHGSGLSCSRARALGSGLRQLWLAGSRAQAQ